jgi:hypothetical protein
MVAITCAHLLWSAPPLVYSSMVLEFLIFRRQWLTLKRPFRWMLCLRRSLQVQLTPVTQSAIQSKESLYQIWVMEGRKAFVFSHQLVVMPDSPSSGKPKSRSMEWC